MLPNLHAEGTLEEWFAALPPEIVKHAMPEADIIDGAVHLGPWDEGERLELESELPFIFSQDSDSSNEDDASQEE